MAAAIWMALPVHAAPVLPAPLSALVPSGYLAVDVIHGDLNHDGEDDVVLLLKATDTSAWVVNHFGKKVDRNRRGLLIAFGHGTTYTLALQNLRCFSSENEDGGVYFPPELSLSIKNGSLMVEYAHGRYGYWSYNFRHQQGDFVLIGYDRSNDHGPVVQSVISINLLSGKVLRKVNTNQDAQGGDERFKETWQRIRDPKTIALSRIADFDDLSIEDQLGIRP